MKWQTMIVTIMIGLAPFVFFNCFGSDSNDDGNQDGDFDQSDTEFPSVSGGDNDQSQPNPSSVSYAIVDTGQVSCFGNEAAMTCPSEGEAFFGQDAQYDGNTPRYTVNGDGTVTDQVTGLMWQRDPGEKQTYSEAVAAVDSFELAGYDDWRVPTVKELYSLILFSGRDIDPTSEETGDMTPFIDDETFGFSYGDTSTGDRVIDSQWVTSSIYTETVMGGEECFFGVNFADGRIKCYPTQSIENKGYFAIYVRGGETYGQNDFADNGDGTITDAATGLMWQKSDSVDTMNWSDALDYCEGLDFAGYQDWKLPNAKQLQSLVDYSRSPGTTNSAAIDPTFQTTAITNEAGQSDFGWYWTSSTHADKQGGSSGAYVTFGRALGYMNDTWMDVHGAGCQRSDPKAGDPADYPNGFGPQGDAIRIYNFVRCVRDADIFNANPDGNDDLQSGDEELVPGDEDLEEQEAEPVACTMKADCQVEGACPTDAAMGCDCTTTPGGKACVPLCNNDEDCPDPPDQTLVCGQQGFCVPQDR